MHIRDVRVGMWVVLNENKVRCTKGKAYQVISTADEDDGEEGIINIRDDAGRFRALYARRFIPAVHVVGGDPLNIPAAALIPFADMAAERAPEAPQQAAVGVAIPVAQPIPQAAPVARHDFKVGDKVILIRPVNPELLRGRPGWAGERMNRMVEEAKEWEIDRVFEHAPWVSFKDDPNHYSYHVNWLALVANARPFAVGDVVRQEGFQHNRFTVLALLDDGKITISKNNQPDSVLGTWDEKLFELVELAFGIAAQPAIIDKVAIKFAVGELAKVVKKANAKHAKWHEAMDETIGEIHKVVRYDDWAGAYELANGFLYSVDSLTKPAEGEVPIKKKKAVVKKDDLRKLIAESRKNDIEKVRGVASYVSFIRNMKTGKIRLDKNLSDVCHARLNVYGIKPYEEVAAVIDYQHYHQKQISKGFEKSYKKFVDYIVNQSPWRVAFQGKTVKNILDNGVLMNVEAPSGAIAGGCMALRFLSEFTGQNATWKLMMDNGIQGDAAFLTTYAFTKGADGNYSQFSMTGGHQPISGDLKAGALLSFFANGYNQDFLKGEPHRKNSRYQVHVHVNETLDKLDLGGQQYSTYVSKNAKGNVVRDGWAEAHIYTEAQVLAFARHLEEQLAKAKVAV